MDLDLDALKPDGIRPLRRVEYEKLVEAGVFEGEHVELLYGVIVQMSPQGHKHWLSVMRLNKLLVFAMGDRADVAPQLGFAASDDSQPEPDVAVYPPGAGERKLPDRAWLIAEVADSSLRKDRTLKARLYAEAKVPEYWVVDVIHETVEVFRSPRGGSYRKVEHFGRGESITLLKCPDVVIRVDDVLASPRRRRAR